MQIHGEGGVGEGGGGVGGKLCCVNLRARKGGEKREKEKTKKRRAEKEREGEGGTVKEAEDARNRENKRAEEEERGEDAGAGGDLLKNGVVKHSTHIVSRLFTPFAHTFPPPVHIFIGFFQPFLPGIFYPEMSIFNFREIFIPRPPPPAPVEASVGTFQEPVLERKTRDA